MARSGQGGSGAGEPGAGPLTPSEAAFEELRARLEEIGPTGYVLVDEVVDGERQRRGRVQLVEFVNTWGDQVGDQWGAGSYVCDARDAKAFIKRGIELRFSASYGAGKKGKGAAAPAAGAAVPATPAADPTLALLLAEIRAQASREHDVLMEVLKKPSAPAAVGLTAADVAREVERVMARQVPAGPRMGQAELFELAEKLVRSVRGAGTDEDALTLAIREGASFMGKIFDADQRNKSGANGGAGAGGNGHGAGGDKGGKGVDFRAMAYRSMLGQLLEAHKAGYTAEQTAAEFWKNLPGELVGAVYEALQREDWLEFLAGYTPAILECRDWFGELRAELLKAYAENAPT